MTENQTQSTAGLARWRGFWQKGGVWRALLVAVVYIALYLGTGRLVGLLFGDSVDLSNPLGSPEAAFLTLVLPIAAGALILVGFAASVGWMPKQLFFGRQTMRGRWWMWIGIALAIVPILGRIFTTDYLPIMDVIAIVFFGGLCIGVAEEVLTRGIAVNLLRAKGYNEWIVMVVSAALFATLHFSNLFSGQELMVVLPTVGYTFAFGIIMYLTLRVGGSLIFPILLHAMTDPTTILATGGIDNVGGGTSDKIAELIIAGGTLLMVVYAIIIATIFARFFIKQNAEKKLYVDKSAA